MVTVARRRLVDGPLIAYTAAKVLPGLLLFLAVPLWTRSFGLAAYGLYAACWATALFTSALTTGWLRQALLRFTGDSGLSLSALPRWVIPSTSAISAIPAALVLIGIQGADEANALQVIISGTVFAASNTVYSILQAHTQRQGDSLRYTVAEVMRVGIALGGSLVLGYFLDGAAAILFAYSLGTIAGMFILKRVPSASLPPSGRRAVLRSLWSYGWPMTFWLASSTSLTYIDRTVLGSISGAEVAGSYAAISDLVVRGFAMVAFPLTMVAHPAVMKLWNQGSKREALALNRKYTRGLMGVSAALLAGVLVLGVPIVEAVLGHAVDDPGIVFLLACGAAVWQLALLVHKPLEMLGKTKLMASFVVAIAIVTFLGNFIAIPIYGAIACAWIYAAGALAYLVGVALMNVKVVQGVGN